MYCSTCGTKLPEGRLVCDRCAPLRPEFAPATGVHPACHAIAGLVGYKVLMGLFGLWNMAIYMMSRPGFVQSARYSFLMIPVSPYTYLMIQVVILVTMVACVAGLYRKDPRAWAVLLGLRALLLPFALYGSYRFLALTFGGGPGITLLFSLMMNLASTLSDVALIVILLTFKRHLVR